MSFGLRKDSNQAAKDAALETAMARVEAMLTDASVPPGLADHFRGQWVDKFPLCEYQYSGKGCVVRVCV